MGSFRSTIDIDNQTSEQGDTHDQKCSQPGSTVASVH
jgi:hypothetical protein